MLRSARHSLRKRGQPPGRSGRVMHDQIVRRAPAVVMLPGEIDVSNAPRVFDHLSSPFAAGATVVIADLTKTVFCDSTGLGTLLRVQRQAATHGAELRLAISPGSPV